MRSILPGGQILSRWVQAWGSRAEVQELVVSSQQSVEQACLQGLPRPTCQLVRLLQSSGHRYYQGISTLNQPIDFDTWRSKIITKDLVDSVQRNYEDLSSRNYDLQNVFDSIFSKDSKAIDEIVLLV